MAFTSSVTGFAVIVALYVTIGTLAAGGTVWLSKSIFGPRAEQRFFGLFLIPIAGFYLAFTAHFGQGEAWPAETAAVAVFTVFGLVGLRVTPVLIAGYFLHGLWDALHEFEALSGWSWLDTSETTPVPLGYGFFCAAYDWFLVGYFFTRRHEWGAARARATRGSAGAAI